MTLLMITSIIALFFIMNITSKIVDKNKVKDLIIHYCKINNLTQKETNALLSIAEQESNFNPFAEVKTEKENSYGLFQFNLKNPPLTGIDLNKFKTDIDYQIILAIKYFKQLRSKNYSIEDIFHIWNVGETKFLQGIKSPNFNKYYSKYAKWSSYYA